MTRETIAQYVAVGFYWVVAAMGSGGLTHVVKQLWRALRRSGRISHDAYAGITRSTAIVIGAGLGAALPWPVILDGWGFVLGAAAGWSATKVQRRFFGAADGAAAKLGLGKVGGETTTETPSLSEDEVATLPGG